MAHDAELEKRITEILKTKRHIVIKKMFGGICFMHRGNMLCGIDKSRLMVRVGPEQYEFVLTLKYATVMDITGKPLKGFIFIRPHGIRTNKELKGWIDLGLAFTSSLPAKNKSSKKAKK